MPQSFYIDEFADEGIMFEGAAGPPDYLAMGFPFSRERHRELMLSFRNLSQFGVMVSDVSRGSVRERAGRPEIRYDLVQEDVDAFRRGIELLAELYRAAGATPGLPAARRGSPRDRCPRDLRAHDLTLMAFHPLGTARADARPAHGVVDGDLKLHGVEGVYVADASVVPSSLGVNPQITIMALATRLAYHLLGKPAPDDEPEPETIAQPAHRARARAVSRPSRRERPGDEPVEDAVRHPLGHRPAHLGVAADQVAGLGPAGGQRVADHLAPPRSGSIPLSSAIFAVSRRSTSIMRAVELLGLRRHARRHLRRRSRCPSSRSAS